jgi:hypothetical protein
MLRMFAVAIVLLIGCGAACGQETQSVLVNPPVPQVQQVQPPVQVPQVTYVMRRGFFGAWRVEPVSPVQFVVVRPAPRPVVMWTPWVVWR